MATATIQSQAEMTISILDLSLEDVKEGKVVNVGTVEKPYAISSLLMAYSISLFAL